MSFSPGQGKGWVQCVRTYYSSWGLNYHLGHYMTKVITQLSVCFSFKEVKVTKNKLHEHYTDPAWDHLGWGRSCPRVQSFCWQWYCSCCRRSPPGPHPDPWGAGLPTPSGCPSLLCQLVSSLINVYFFIVYIAVLSYKPTSNILYHIQTSTQGIFCLAS